MAIGVNAATNGAVSTDSRAAGFDARGLESAGLDTDWTSAITELFGVASAESGLGTFLSGLDVAGTEAWAGCIPVASGFRLFGAWLGEALTVGPAVAVSGLEVSL